MAPNDAENDRLAIGGNRPPSPMTAAELPFYLAEENAGLLRRRTELVEGLAAFLAKYPSIQTEDVAAGATENIELVRRALAAVEDRRQVAKAPYLAGGKAVDTWFGAVEESLKQAVAPLRAAHRVFLLAKEARERKAAEAEAARLAAEAAEAAAQAQQAGDAGEAAAAFEHAAVVAKHAEDAEQLAAGKPGPLTRTMGSYGSTSSLQEVPRFQIVDVRKVPRQYCSPDERLIRAAVKSGVRVISGVRIWVDREVRSR